MKRRLFFRTLIGAAPVAAAVASPAPEQLAVTGSAIYCSCGTALIWHGKSYEGMRRNSGYFTCTRETCSQFGIPLAAPSVAVERADQRIVAKIQAEERRAQEEYWRAEAKSRPSLQFNEPALKARKFAALSDKAQREFEREREKDRAFLEGDRWTSAT